MPSGVYRYDDGSAERFTATTAPAGWRYVAAGDDRVDVTLDSRWRQARVEVALGGWWLRGGIVGRELVWVRGSTGPAAGPGAAGRATEDAVEAFGFTGRSPAFIVATARALALSPGQRLRLRLVELAGPALVPLLVERAWTLDAVEEHPTPSGPLRVERFLVDDLATGGRAVVHLAGDVVLAAPGVELTDLDGPPYQPR